ncbi:hypothetical protein HPB48_023994 [Haemaphysalis longicornis]|uniref:Abasic site processing protein HMCES n=1 Tax=Haemaphysalis longicornis TaxID=44386 RepID=A0A9J6H8A7_HAELO|nr:hypothetical protein HPB48_023994 [Haemaphysalis longicornis]
MDGRKLKVALSSQPGRQLFGANQAWPGSGGGGSSCPVSCSPVLVHSRHAAEECESEVVATVMQWGLVPSWFRGEPQAFRINTINCRSEGCTERLSYKPAITTGKRCVVVAEG